MNRKMVLGFQIAPAKRQALQKLCTSLGIEYRETAVKEQHKTLGALAQIPGIPAVLPPKAGESTANPKAANAKPCMAAAIPAGQEMLVFSGLDEETLHGFLDACRETKIPPTPLKAMVTVHNIFWTPQRLYTELQREHAEMMRLHAKAAGQAADPAQRQRPSAIQAGQMESGSASHPLRARLGEFDAVIFDMDGTLVDSMWMWYEIDVQYLGRFGIEPPRDLQKEIEGMSFSETASYFKETFRLPDSLEQIKADWNAMACEKYRHEVPFKNGAEKFLQRCKAEGRKLGVATSNSRELVNALAEALPLNDYMDCIVTACEVERGKPAPDVYLETAKRLGCDPHRCLVFEDLPAGIRAGKAAGMMTCALKDDYSSDVWEEKTHLADYFITDFIELL